MLMFSQSSLWTLSLLQLPGHGSYAFFSPLLPPLSVKAPGADPGHMAMGRILATQSASGQWAQSRK